MRFEGTRPSGKDKDIPLYNFVFGKEELIALHKALEHFLNSCPRITETQTIRTRLTTMLKALHKFDKDRLLKDLWKS